MKSKKSHKGELNISLIYALWQCFESMKGLYCGELQICFRFRTTSIKCMEIFFVKVCTFWSPQPTMTCSAISLQFTRKWIKGIAIVSGACCLSATSHIHHPTGRHNRLPSWSIQSNNTHLNLWWYCAMKTISRTMVDWKLSSPELLLWFAYVRSQGVDGANENRW